MRVLIFLSFLILIFLFGALVQATPYLFNPIPEDNSYIQGGPRTFYINISESNLNTSSVALYIKAEDEISFEKFNMECENSTLSDWLCNAIVPFGIVGSDTTELFYFNASDNLGNSGYNGTAKNPLKVAIDKNSPSVTYVNPTNESWVRGVEKIELSVTDVSSGVNNNSVQFSFDNITWTQMKNVTLGKFEANWTTTSLANNQTVTLYTKASDNVANTRYSWINITVDNEIPSISILQPEENQKLAGIVNFQINVSDRYSGIDSTSVFYKVDEIKKGMDCTGNICSKYFDTTLLPDGEYTVSFNASDQAGNANSTSVKVQMTNANPIVSITSPSNSSFINKKTFINSTVHDPIDTIQYLQIKIEKPGYSSGWLNMSKEKEYFYLWDTSRVEEGSYSILVKAVNTLNYLINHSIQVTVDNTNPEITVLQPGEYVKGESSLSIVVIDSFATNPETVYFNISNSTKTMHCTQQLGGKKSVCSTTFNFSILDDGSATLLFYSEDLAGNSNSTEKGIKIDNKPPVLEYIKIEPIYSGKATDFNFSIYGKDYGSYITSVDITIHHPDGSEESITLSQGSSWTVKKVISTVGIHTLDITMSDLNGNTVNFESAGFFYIGSINCGDGICSPNETYCICSSDCSPPKCEANEVIDCGSGIPKCMTLAEIEIITQPLEKEVTQPLEEPEEKKPIEIIQTLTEKKILIPSIIAIFVLLFAIFYIVRRKPSKPKKFEEIWE